MTPEIETDIDKLKARIEELQDEVARAKEESDSWQYGHECQEARIKELEAALRRIDYLVRLADHNTSPERPHAMPDTTMIRNIVTNVFMREEPK